MPFQNLRANNLIYILYKNEVPTLEIGKVVNVSLPIPRYTSTNMYNSQDMVIDISATVNNQPTNFQKLPALGEIADFGNNIVVSCNRDAMNNEIISMKLKSQDIINSIEAHLKIIEGCDQMLSLLNPEIIEKLKQEQETKALREEINSLKDMFKELMVKLS